MSGRSRFVMGLIVMSAGLASAPQAWAAQAPPAADTAPAPADELVRLREELAALRRDYEARLSALEARLAAFESPAAAGQPSAGTAAGTPSAEGPSAPPTPVADVSRQPATPPASTKFFNPDIAVIGNFIGAATGTRTGAEPSLEMRETELSFQAVVDPFARADFFLTVGPEEVGVEEGYLTFPALPGGILMKVGRMRDVFGKVDSQHSHTLPFVDRPLVVENLLGGEEGLADSGISLARLIPNPWLFLEATGQVFRGQSEVFAAPRRRDLAYVGHLRAYRDITESTNLDLGGSIAYGHNDAGPGATTRLLGVDATLRWRPLRRSIYTHLLARGELVFCRREQPGDDPSTVGNGDLFAPGGDIRTLGGYAYLEYQFGRRWTAGLRYDDTGRATEAGRRDRGGSFILTYAPSEFSQVRAQFRHTRLAEEKAANELLFQFLFAIGAHGAHPF